MDDIKNSEIEKYIHHLMNKNERFLFEERMNNDPELKENVLLEINLHKTFNENFEANSTFVNDKKIIDRLKLALDNDDVKKSSEFIRKSTREFQKQRKRSLQLIYRVTGVVAAMVLITFMLKATIKSDANTYYEQYADFTNLPSLVEKGEEENNLNKIEQLFNTQKYSEVVSLSIDDKDPYQLIYKGASFVKLEDYKNAIQTFNTLIKTESLESSRGYWYNALIYLKQNNAEKAKEMLNKTLENKDNFNYEKALKLIDEL